MILILPIILIPVLVMAAESHTLSVAGTLQPGGAIAVSGSNYDNREYVELSWDGGVVAWLPVTKTDRSGRLTVSASIPAATPPGAHVLEARMKRNGKNSAAMPDVLVRTTVMVGGSVLPPGAAPVLPPSPTVTPTATAVPTPRVTASPTPTATATATATTASPTATASPSPTTTPTRAPSPTPSASPVVVPPAAGPVAGYGASTVGGSGGRVLAVTTLADAGTGSLRAALESSGPRTIVFKVGGTIRLASDLKISDPFVTVAGETAPSPVVLRDGGTIVRTHEVIIRNLRFRPGDNVSAPSDVDALTLNGMDAAVYNVVIDHVTMIWGPDIGGLAVLGDVRSVTVSNSIMGEGLYLSRHAEGTAAQGGHSHAANLTQLDGGSAWPRYITFVGNLFTTADTRIPRLQGAGCVDLVNNVIYNWGLHAAHGNPRSVNLVNNYYRHGPESRTTELWDAQTSVVAPSLFPASVYESGNYADGFTAVRGGGTSIYASTARCGSLSVTPQSAQTAYASVLANAGATLPVRDTVDERIISNVKSRTGSFMNGSGASAPNPYWP
jgi:pectate lyase